MQTVLYVATSTSWQVLVKIFFRQMKPPRHCGHGCEAGQTFTACKLADYEDITYRVVSAKDPKFEITVAKFML